MQGGFSVVNIDRERRLITYVYSVVAIRYPQCTMPVLRGSSG